MPLDKLLRGWKVCFFAILFTNIFHLYLNVYKHTHTYRHTNNISIYIIQVWLKTNEILCLTLFLMIFQWFVPFVWFSAVQLEPRLWNVFIAFPALTSHYQIIYFVLIGLSLYVGIAFLFVFLRRVSVYWWVSSFFLSRILSSCINLYGWPQLSFQVHINAQSSSNV